MDSRFFRPGLLAAVFMLVFSFPALSLADEGQRPGLGLARVAYINGDTLFNSQDTDDWAALSPNFTLRDGDRLWAGEDSKLEVGLSGGHFAWLNYESELDITKLDRNGRGDTFQVGLPAGEASFMVKRLGSRDSVFQVDTPNASVRAYGKARFRVSALSDGSSQVGVSDGSVEVESDEGVTDLQEGDMAEISPNGEVNITSLPDEDDWDSWVDSRANRYARPGRSARYLPADLAPYSYEFDTGGRWVSYPDYGSVWVPVVAAGWSPYSNGRWCWVADDYVWLPYDPWYAPFHYGRWSWSVSLGWFWVPPLRTAIYWSPGYVSWVWGPDYVGWVPLAPRETYYGYGNYGPDSVNIYNTKVVNVTNVYVNSKVNNAVVVVNKNNFVKGEIKRVAIKEKAQNPFINKNVLKAQIIGRPPVKEIKPTRELKLPKPQIRPAAKALPPARIEKLAPVVIKRPLARQPQASVMKPGARPRKLDREVLKERRPAERAERKAFRAKEAAPATAPAAQGKEKERLGGRPERREKPGRAETETPRGQERERPGRTGVETPRGQERERPERGKSGGFEMPGRTRPTPSRERAPRERERVGAPNRGEEVTPGRRGMERAPEAAPERRAPAERERGAVEPQDRPKLETGPARRMRENPAPELGGAERNRPVKVRREGAGEGGQGEQVAPSAGRARKNDNVQPGRAKPEPAAEKEGKAKGEGRKIKGPRDKDEEAQ